MLAQIKDNIHIVRSNSLYYLFNPKSAVGICSLGKKRSRLHDFQLFYMHYTKI